MSNTAKQRAKLLAKEILALEQKWLRDEKVMLRDIAVELLQKSAALAEMIVDGYPPLAAKIGGQAFQIPPHDQAPNLEGKRHFVKAPTPSAEVETVNEILDSELGMTDAEFRDLYPELHDWEQGSKDDGQI